jgi:hypothetical protein
MLVDLDWGSEVGGASYPTFDPSSELLEDRISDNLKIMNDDDVRVLTKTLRIL